MPKDAGARVAGMYIPAGERRANRARGEGVMNRRERAARRTGSRSAVARVVAQNRQNRATQGMSGPQRRRANAAVRTAAAAAREGRNARRRNPTRAGGSR